MPDQKYAAITGGGKGIGLGIAEKLIEGGWFIFLLDIDQTQLKNASVKLGDHNCAIIHCDVTDSESVQSAFDTISEKTTEKLDLLVNNAGIILVGDFDTISLEKHHKVVDVNLKGVVNTTYYALPLLKNTIGSRILNISSASSLIGNPELPLYAATKSAVKSLTEAWSMSFKKYGIKVSDLLPMYVQTDLVKNNYQDFKNLNESKVKLTVDDVVKAVQKAIKGDKIHYYVGVDAKAFSFFKNLTPIKLQQFILKKVIGYQ